MKLKILSLNFWLLPFGYSTDNRIRLKKFLKIVEEENPDIIALQEIWLKKDYKFLKRNLKNYNSYCKSNFIRIFGGLVVFSKIPMRNIDFKKFPVQKYMSKKEKLLGKGILSMEFRFNNEIFRLLDTHFNFSFNFNYRDKFTEKNFQILKSKIDDRPTIMCGDLNTPKNLFEKRNKEYFKYLENEINTFSSKNKYTHVSYNKDIIEKDIKLDYILIKTPNANYSFKSKIIGRELSDHEAIITEVEFS